LFNTTIVKSYSFVSLYPLSWNCLYWLLKLSNLTVLWEQMSFYYYFLNINCSYIQQSWLRIKIKLNQIKNLFLVTKKWLVINKLRNLLWEQRISKIIFFTVGIKKKIKSLNRIFVLVLFSRNTYYSSVLG